MKPLRAFNLPLKELEASVFFRAEAEFKPHYVITRRGDRISRVNIWGIVTKTFESENNFASISLDDFTGSIDVNAFDENTKHLLTAKKGDTVKVIGKVRENKNGIYVLMEGMQKINFEEEMEKRLETVKFGLSKPVTKKKEKKENFDEFKQASEIKIEREVIG